MVISNRFGCNTFNAFSSVTGSTVLVTIPSHDVNVYKSLRNIAGVSVLPVSELNAWEVLHPKRLLMTTAALDAIREKTESK